jgi:hypothetical protein
LAADPQDVRFKQGRKPADTLSEAGVVDPVVVEYMVLPSELCPSSSLLVLAALFPAIEVVDEDDRIGEIPWTTRAGEEVLIYPVAQLVW